jgi:SAM-dependent methyltransferase
MIAAAQRAAAWHDLECGGYAADLALWSALARESAGPVLELGCGTGRVALHLAAEGFEVVGLDSEQPLLDALADRAAERGLEVETVRADALSFELGRRFALICAPMQLAHLLDAAGRSSLLRCAAAHLLPGGRVALALLAESLPSPDDAPPPLPDVAEHDGWVYSSQPLEVAAVPGGFEVRRLRQLVSPAGELASELDVIRLEALSPAALAAEAADVGLTEVERLDVGVTDDHVGSVVCVLEAAG